MLKIEITTSSGRIRLAVDQVEFVRICPHCDMEFLTIDPDQIYPSVAHRVGGYKIRKALAESRHYSIEITASSGRKRLLVESRNYGIVTVTH